MEGECSEAVGHRFGELESGEVDKRTAAVTLPVLVVDGHPPARRRRERKLADMNMARPAKATHAPRMKIPSTRRSTFQHIAKEELDVALCELSSGRATCDA
ncbi:hypothetical protein ERJ75_001639000 [Trypanosoma vivax]|nr:hypothetical protein ERJ75_001639000 [Trypanosoma vivax]